MKLKIKTPTVSAITRPYPALSPDIPSNSLAALLTKKMLTKIIDKLIITPYILNTNTEIILESIKHVINIALSAFPVPCLKNAPNELPFIDSLDNNKYPIKLLEIIGININPIILLFLSTTV